MSPQERRQQAVTVAEVEDALRGAANDLKDQAGNIATITSMPDRHVDLVVAILYGALNDVAERIVRGAA